MFRALYHTRRSFYDAVTSYPAARHRSDWNTLAGSNPTSQLRNRHKAGWAICAPAPMDIAAARAVFPVQYGYETITFYYHNSTRKSRSCSIIQW